MNIIKLTTNPSYGVNSAGEAYSLKGATPKILKPFKTGGDKQYLRVRLYDGISFQDMSVHRLVAMTFIPNPLNLETVNHKDENKFNNCVDNLEWMTSGDNKRYSCGKTFTLINPEGEPITEPSIGLFSSKYGLSNGCIYFLLSGKYKQHRGWTLPTSSSFGEDRTDS